MISSWYQRKNSFLMRGGAGQVPKKKEKLTMRLPAALDF